MKTTLKFLMAAARIAAGQSSVVPSVYDRRRSIGSLNFRRSQNTATTILLAVFAIFCGQFLCSAQVQQAWVAKYNNGILSGTNQAVKMVFDVAGNIYVTGFSQNATNGNLDYVTIKYDYNGNLVWSARYVGTNTTTAIPTGIALDTSNNVIVTGSAITVKYSNSGTQLWTSTNVGGNIAVDASNNVFVPASDLVKLNPGGSNMWQVGPVLALWVSVDVGGNSYVAGYFRFFWGSAGPYYMGTVTKYDPNGNEIWYEQYRLGNYFFPNVQSTALDPAGNFYVLLNGPGPGGTSYQTGKFSGSTGSPVWGAGDPTQGNYSMVKGFALDNLGNVWVTGANAYNYPNTQYGTYKINTNGAYTVTDLYPAVAVGNSEGTSIAIDRANNVYVTGYSPGTNTGNDIVTIKYDNSGNQLWLERYNGPGNGDDEGNAIAVDALGNVYVTGYETTAAGGTEMVTIKYAPAATIQKQGNGSFLLQEQGEPGEAFDFQASTNLQTWLDLGTNNADTNGFVQFLDTNATNFAQRFYLSVPQ